MITRLNPVKLPHGAQMKVDEEVRLSGTLPLDISRAYSPDFTAPSPLGPGHLTDLDLTITDGEEAGTYAVMTLDGIAVIFDRPDPQLFTRSYNDGFRHLSLEPLHRAGLKLNDRKMHYIFKRYRGRIWRITEIGDLNGNRIALNRDAAGLLQEVVHPDGLRLRFQNRVDGLRAGYDIIGLDGTVMEGPRYDYDGAGRLIAVQHPFGESWVYAWDEAGRRTYADNGQKTRVTHRHDAQGRVVEVDTGGSYKHGSLDYDPNGKLITVHHGEGGTEWEKFWFDDLGRQFMKSDALGRFSYREFNANHDVIAEVDENGHRTAMAYDAFGNLQSRIDPEGREVFTIWDDLGNPLSITRPGGETETFVYDDVGRLDQHKGPAGHVTNFRYTDTGQLAQVMRHDGLIEFRSYDDRNRLVSIIDTGSHETTFAYDAFNRPVEITDPNGGVTRLAYGPESFHTPNRITRPDGVVTERHLTRTGRVESVTDGEGRTTRYTYGAYGILEEITDPKGGTLRFAYDSRERLVCVTNQMGLHWTFARDAVGRVITETDFDGRTLHYGYDPAGRVVRRDNPDGGHLEYDYDASGLLVEMRAFAPDATDPLVTTYAYDDNGALIAAKNPDATIALERDARGMIVAETVNGHRVESMIDCCGKREQRRIGGQVVSFTYDGVGGLTGWELEGHAPLSLTRDALGQEVERTNGQGFTLRQSWDTVGQLLHQTASGIVDRRYDWTRAYEPLVITDARHGTKRYDYDRNGQITRTLHGDGGRSGSPIPPT